MKEMEKTGHIALHYKLLDNPLWTCEAFSRGQAWAELLLLAAHTDSYFYVRGLKVKVKRGQFASSEATLSERWKWSRKKLRKFLRDLEKEQQITIIKLLGVLIISISNYFKYQDECTYQ